MSKHLTRPDSSPTLAQVLRSKLGTWKQWRCGRKVASWIEHGVEFEWIRGPPRPFHQGVSMKDLDEGQRVFFEMEKQRYCEITLVVFRSSRFVSTFRFDVVFFRYAVLGVIQESCSTPCAAHRHRQGQSHPFFLI